MKKQTSLLQDKLNVILVGESGVGKTSLLNQYTKGVFCTQLMATIGTIRKVILRTWVFHQGGENR